MLMFKLCSARRCANGLHKTASYRYTFCGNAYGAHVVNTISRKRIRTPRSFLQTVLEMRLWRRQRRPCLFSETVHDLSMLLMIFVDHACISSKRFTLVDRRVSTLNRFAEMLSHVIENGTSFWCRQPSYFLQTV